MLLKKYSKGVIIMSESTITKKFAVGRYYKENAEGEASAIT